MLFDIWSADNGPSRLFHGSCEGENFQQACYEYAAKSWAFRRKFNPLKLTFNGYKLYPTEQEVLDSFSL